MKYDPEKIELYSDTNVSTLQEHVELTKRVNEALEIAFRYSQIDGSHHKAWCIDQMVAMLTKDDYEKFVEGYRGTYDEVNEEYEYEWDEGIAP